MRSNLHDQVEAPVDERSLNGLGEEYDIYRLLKPIVAHDLVMVGRHEVIVIEIRDLD